MIKKNSPQICVVGGRRSTSRAILNIWCDFNSNTPRRKGKGDCSKHKKININYQTKPKILRRIK